jgi:hypothetical protein
MIYFVLYVLFFGLLAPSSLKEGRGGSEIEQCSEKHYILRRIKYLSLGSEVLTPVIMKTFIFWDISPCNRRFGVTYHLCSACYFTLASYLTFYPTLKMEATLSRVLVTKGAGLDR